MMVVPLVGLETVSATGHPEGSLRQSESDDDAQSGAVTAERPSTTLTPDALAAALFSLSPDERALLAAVLLKQPEGG
jgi:hypothetical protein